MKKNLGDILIVADQKQDEPATIRAGDIYVRFRILMRRLDWADVPPSAQLVKHEAKFSVRSRIKLTSRKSSEWAN